MENIVLTLNFFFYSKRFKEKTKQKNMQHLDFSTIFNISPIPVFSHYQFKKYLVLNHSRKLNSMPFNFFLHLDHSRIPEFGKYYKLQNKFLFCLNYLPMRVVVSLIFKLQYISGLVYCKYDHMGQFPLDGNLL